MLPTPHTTRSRSKRRTSGETSPRSDGPPEPVDRPSRPRGGVVVRASRDRPPAGRLLSRERRPGRGVRWWGRVRPRYADCRARCCSSRTRTRFRRGRSSTSTPSRVSRSGPSWSASGSSAAPECGKSARPSRLPSPATPRGRLPAESAPRDGSVSLARRECQAGPHGGDGEQDGVHGERRVAAAGCARHSASWPECCSTSAWRCRGRPAPGSMWL